MTHSMLHRNALASALALALLAPLAAQAQDTPQGAAPDNDVTQVDKVTVTGSRIKRAELEGPAPVTILTAEQIQAEGFVTVYDALATLNEAIGTVEADVQWGSHTPNASPLNLRNLGPGRSLLLVNGRRVADYPLPYGGQSNFANYANIPTAAVERIEVLTGGASAIYGSDAMAGVINVILKQNYDGDEVRIRGGTSTEGGRDTWDLSWAGGKTGEQWGVTYALQWTKRDPLFGRDRPEMDDSDDAPYSSWNPEQRKVGFRPFTGLALLDAANGNRRIAPPSGTCDKFRGEYYLADRLLYNYDADTVTNTGQLCGLSADFANWLLRSGSEDWSGYTHATWDFENGMQAWVNVALYDAKGIWGTSPPSLQLTDGPSGGPFIDANTGRRLRGVRNFTPFEVGGFENLTNLSKEQSWDLSAGLRGTVFDGRFNWDASLGRSRYTVHERIATVDWDLAQNFFLGPQLGTQDGLPVYNFNEARWWNPVSPQEYRQFGTHSINDADSWVNQAAFSFSGDLFEGWAGPIGFAAVLEAAQQGYRLNPDPRGNLDYWVQNIDRGGGERTRYSGGVEFKVPLLESLTATLAGRYDRYGDYKAYDSAERLDIGTQSESTWNAGLEWRPLDSLLLRGTYATSFRAPDMHYLLAQPSTATVLTEDDFRCIDIGAYLTNDCGRENEFVNYAFDINRRGTPDLQAEHGDSWTVGFVWDVLDNLELTADYWSIDLEDEIKDINEDTILRDEAGCRTGKTTDPAIPWSNPGGADYCASIIARVNRDPVTGQIISVERGPINIAQKHVEGIDASLLYRLDTARWGNFQFGLNYTNMRSFKEQTYRTDPNPERRDRDIRSKIRGSVSWQGEAWNWNVYADRIGAVPGVRYHWDANNLEKSGGCRPFPDGYVPSDSLEANCSVPAGSSNPNAGQRTERYYGRVGPSITWNFNVGYRITDRAKVNFYVNNVFNSTGWNHKDPYKLDYEFYNSRLFSPVGREVALEYVFNFD